MKRTKAIPASLLIALSITGCKAPFSDEPTREKSQDPIEDITYSGPPHTTQKLSKDNLDIGSFGYVHYKRKQGAGNAVQQHDIPKIDNRELADIISRLELSLPNIYEVGTLVTDQYVLIGYQSDLKDKKQAASQVKMTALSVVPNYYKVYISDAFDAIERISRYKDLTVQTPRVHKSLQHMINEMKKSPQGNITKNNVKNQGMNEDKRKNTNTNDQINAKQNTDYGNKTDRINNEMNPMNQ
ncbi:sporulation lipoprotein YhcN/YlaJ [Scopulibacillus darangshiensis]|uniref:Sporulation lipoprotein YhcN/YlaJ n=1 Tax=Scopulibacillus darangshiensis TaxID=442528 RepID=A0A4R2NDH6_9BACL|nr:YhcN/YlaJ family sporulation lipoprotein [Scopulibacillus darangshiensis]TCP19134.1 sporulation lipoprotein YhcN/YlaJ [Scopulibacillus darangshiensis]